MAGWHSLPIALQTSAALPPCPLLLLLLLLLLRSLGVDAEPLRTEAQRRLKGDEQDSAPRRKKAVRVMVVLGGASAHVHTPTWPPPPGSLFSVFFFLTQSAASRSETLPFVCHVMMGIGARVEVGIDA